MEEVMKRSFFMVMFVLVFAMTSITAFAQQDKIRKSLPASVSQTIGVDTKITIDYSRPGVKDRVIWGELVPYGLNPGNRYSNDKPFPWRAGANENTTIEFSKDVLVDGHKLAAGKYGLHMIPGKEEWVIIFNTINDSWGSFQYDESKDALRVSVLPLEAPFCEWLMYGFDQLDGTSARAYLHWEKLLVPFTISLPE